jgi:hypothetical protein
MQRKIIPIFPLILFMISTVFAETEKPVSRDFVFTYNDSEFIFTYEGTHDVHKSDNSLKRCVFSHHGGSRNPDVYFERMVTALKQAAEERNNPALERETMVIGPHMLSKECYEKNRDRYNKGHYPYWDDRWRGGIDSENSPKISNFACMDKMILEIHRNYPTIKIFVFAGHSAGGQIISRYSLSNTIHDSLVADGCHVRYVIANPSSFVYLDAYRPDLDNESGFIRITKNPCDSVAFNDWKYGLDNIYPYPASTPVTTMIEKYRNREIVLLLGTKDNDTNHKGLDKKCAGMLQGRHRMERGLRYYEYLGFFYGKDVYSTKFIALVSGVGHHGGEMFQSDVGKYWIFFPKN